MLCSLQELHSYFRRVGVAHSNNKAPYDDLTHCHKKLLWVDVLHWDKNIENDHNETANPLQVLDKKSWRGCSERHVLSQSITVHQSNHRDDQWSTCEEDKVVYKVLYEVFGIELDLVFRHICHFLEDIFFHKELKLLSQHCKGIFWLIISTSSSCIVCSFGIYF